MLLIFLGFQNLSIFLGHSWSLRCHLEKNPIPSLSYHTDIISYYIIPIHYFILFYHSKVVPAPVRQIPFFFLETATSSEGKMSHKAYLTFFSFLTLCALNYFLFIYFHFHVFPVYCTLLFVLVYCALTLCATWLSTQQQLA